MNIEYDTHAHGAFFDGTLAAELHAAIEDAATEIARAGDEIVFRFGAVESFRTHPTWRWENELAITNVSYGRRLVYDTVVYNRWLEGVGSRNYPVTRFRGYWMWRRGTERLRAEAPLIAEEQIDARLAALP